MNNQQSNPDCPHCGSNAAVRVKDRAKGRFYCKECKRSYRAFKRKPGRPPIGDRPLTNAEICQRYWERRGDQREYKRRYMRAYYARKRLEKQENKAKATHTP